MLVHGICTMVQTLHITAPANIQSADTSHGPTYIVNHIEAAVKIKLCHCILVHSVEISCWWTCFDSRVLLQNTDALIHASPRPEHQAQ